MAASDSTVNFRIRRDIGGDEQQISNARTAYSAETFKHILLPIWSAVCQTS